MQVSVEKTSNLGRRLTIEVPAASVQTEEQVRLKDLAKNMRVEGFRQGKVPATFIKQKYGDQIRQEAVTKVLQDTLGAALQEHNMRPADRPNVEDLKDNQGENLTYTVSFEVYPDINLKDFTAVVLEKEVADITAADIESGVKKLQNQFATWQDVSDRATKTGDKVIIDFVGKLDGVPFEHGSAKDQPLELGSNSFIPGFEDGLIGVGLGEEKTLTLTFPESYGASNLAGKEVEFDVKVNKIQAKHEAPLDEDFAARIGIADKDVTKVSDKVRDNMLKYLEDISNTRLREKALEKLFEVHPFDLPDSLVAKEKHNLIHERLNKAADDHNHDLTAEQDLEFTAEAKKRVAIGLLLNEIIVANKIEPEEERILAKIAAMSLMYGGNAEMIRKMYMESKELRQSVQNMVLTDQAADFVVANATIKEKKSSFYEIVDRKAE